jgi:uncharacterized membrane protein YfcA
MKEWIIAAISLSIGLSLGLIGAGGSILTIPAFVYILKMDPLASGIYSMFVVGISSLIGAGRSIGNRLVDFRIAAAFGIPSIIGVYTARKFIFPTIPRKLFSFGGHTMSKDMVFMCAIAILMCAAAIRMLTASDRQRDNNSSNDPVDTRPNAWLPAWLIGQGLLVGLITGLLGIGGGFLIVPALYLWARLPMKTAIGTTLLIIAANSLFGFLNSYSGAAIDWTLLGQFSAGSIIGILIGTKLAERMPGNRLKKIFGWFVLLIAAFVLCKQFF